MGKLVWRLDDREPASSAREHQPQLGFAVPVCVEHRGNLVLEGGPIPLEEDPLSRVLEAVEMVGQRERLPVVELQHLERAVATDEAVVHDRDGRVADRHHRAVDGAQ